MAAAMDAKTVSDKMIKDTFDILDFDKDGTISAKELQFAFKSQSYSKET